MLFKFKSQVTSDLIMLEADARSLLKIMLGADSDKGIILVQDLPAAIAKLESAVAQDEAARLQRSQAAQKAAARPASSSDTPEQALDPVRLAQRASPMLKHLKRCVADPSDLVWGV
jgi:hypothetical protein